VKSPTPKMTNLIDKIVDNAFQMGPNLTSPESAMNITCVGQKRNNIEQYDLLKITKKHMRPNLVV